MIIRASAKLNRQIHVAPDRSLPLSANPYADWSARLFPVGRAQYIAVTNTASLYSVLMRGRGITDRRTFRQRTVSAMREQLAEDGLLFLFERFVAPKTTRVVFSKALNRSVTGSLNDIVMQAESCLAGSMPSLRETAGMLARWPVRALGYASPIDVFASMSFREQ